jgi:Family of unknown function (DUF6152)
MMKMLRAMRQTGLVVAASVGIVVDPAVAHHSFAAYDMNKTQSIDGTLKEFRWGAPHSSMVLIYIDKGKPKQMSIVSGNPLMFARQGFNPRDFKRGDKVMVGYHPNVSGLPGGALASIRLPNGKTFLDTEAQRAN